MTLKSLLWRGIAWVIACLCAYGFLMALGVLEFGDFWRGSQGNEWALFLAVPAASALLLVIGALWEDRGVPALGRLVRRVWPQVDAPPAAYAKLSWRSLVVAIAIVGGIFLWVVLQI